MLLSEVFEQLHFGELSQMRLGDQESPTIAPANFPAVISFINTGLVALYKKFTIRDGQVVLQLYPHITMYHLTTDYAESNTGSTQPYKYIKDLNNPFQDNVLQIVEVHDELGYPISLNDESFIGSVYTPEEKILQVPFPNSETQLVVGYRAYPPKIPTNTVDTTVNVDLPEQFLPALLAYVGYRANIGLTQGNVPRGVTHFTRYKAICKEIEDLGTINKPSPTNENLDNAGWI